MRNMQNVPLAFLDTETTHLIPGVRQIWEVGLILEDTDGSVSELEFQIPIAPVHLTHEADPKALEIGRYFERSVSRPVEDVHDDIAVMDEMLKGAHVIGMCPDFDTFNLIKAKYWLTTPPWYYQVIDVDIFAAGVFLAKGFQVELPFNTNAATKFLGVGIDESVRHTALGDARWTRDFYHALIEFAESERTGTLEDHQTLLSYNSFPKQKEATQVVNFPEGESVFTLDNV